MPVYLQAKRLLYYVLVILNPNKAYMNSRNIYVKGRY